MSTIERAACSWHSEARRTTLALGGLIITLTFTTVRREDVQNEYATVL